MCRIALLCVVVCCLWTTSVSAQSREEKVRNDKQKVEAEGYWIYGDLPRAFAEAGQSGKPIIAVLRCLPCEECVKLDDELIDADKRVKSLLEQFVRVRVVSTNGLDLSLFQFDTDQSFAVFLLNADGTIYGRFGTRSSRSEWIGDVSIDGLAKALEGALALHRDYPASKAKLAGKRGPAPEFLTPEKFPSLKDRYTSKLDYEGKVVQSCIHCHQIGDAVRELELSRHQTLPENMLFPYPHPKAVGLVLDPRQMATVLSVTPGSAADHAGFLAGDAISMLNGQPLLSMADVQWILQMTPPEGGEINAAVTRSGKPVTVTLKLDPGWRRRDDIAWRSSTWGLRRVALGGIFSGELPAEERAKLKLAADAMALLVKHVGQYAPHDIAHRAGVRKGDILVGINGRTDFTRETDVIEYALQKLRPGDKIELTLIRNSAQQSISFHRPK